MKLNDDGTRVYQSQEMTIMHKCQVCMEVVTLVISPQSKCTNCNSIYNTQKLPLIELIKRGV